MEEILFLDDVELPRKLPGEGRLQKKRSREEERNQKIEEVVNGFEFMQEDRELYLSEKDTTSSEEEAVVPIRGSVLARLGFFTNNQHLEQAFNTLSQNDDFENFLSDPVVYRKLDKLWAMLRSFNQGSEAQALKDFWIEHWHGRLAVRKAAFVRHDQECVACLLKRRLTHRVIKIDPTRVKGEETIGYMGPHCYGFKFSLLLKLSAQLKFMLSEKNSFFFDFGEHWQEEVEPLLQEMAEAAIKMKTFYREQYLG